MLVWYNERVRDKVDVLLMNVAKDCSNLVFSKCRIKRANHQNELDFRVCHVAIAVGEMIDSRQ